MNVNMEALVRVYLCVSVSPCRYAPTHLCACVSGCGVHRWKGVHLCEPVCECMSVSVYKCAYGDKDSTLAHWMAGHLYK